MSSRPHAAELPDQSRSIAFDFPGLRIGIAEYDAGPTGTTVLHLPGGAACALDVRGGAPGVVGGLPYTHAVVFAGGSLYGLEAMFGVAATLLEQRGSVSWDTVDLVCGAIIWDFHSRDTIVYPDKALGRQALLAATTGTCPVGQRGAGRAARVGSFGWNWGSGTRPESSGQGAAFRLISETGVRVFVLTVVNAVGAIVNRAGEVVRGCYDPSAGVRRLPRELLAAGTFPPEATPAPGPTQNTTISVVVTNQAMSPRALEQLGRQVHTAMARAIQPFHTPTDGDALFTLSTESIPAGTVNEVALGEIAADLMWDAVLNAVARP